MKKTISLILALILLLALTAGCAAQNSGERIIVTTFYPMYVFAKNVAKDVPGVSVVNMADQSVGCRQWRRHGAVHG